MRRLLVPILLVYSVILFRAAHQAVTLDEADAFIDFSNGNLDMSFYPSSGNHVLNSLLARYTTKPFGVSQFTFRIPALLGAAMYLIAVASIVVRIAPGRKLLGFAVLTLNPFVLDYLIAARGYALAIGFLACAIALGMRLLGEDPPLRTASRISVLFSMCCALAIAANFSFAFCIVATMAALLLTLLRVCPRPLARWVVIAACATVPGVLAGIALLSHTLRGFPRTQLYFGASTWTEMWTEMLDAVFPRQNLSIPSVNLEPILTSAHHVAAYLILIPIAIALWAAFATPAWTIRFVWLALALTLVAHGVAHSLQGLLLPLDRTSLFIAFFLAVVIVHGAANASSHFARNTSTAVLCASLLIFMLAFRTNYFRIWDFDLDVDKGFAALQGYAKEHPLASAGCTWRYASAYKFYRMASRSSGQVPACDLIDQDHPPPRAAYFLDSQFQNEFIVKAQLQIIYQGPVSGLTVGVAPLDKKEPPE